MQKVEHIVVAGASAGGIEAVCRLLSSFKEPVNAAVLVVIHLSVRSNAEVIATYFRKHSKLECLVAEDGLALKNNTVYLARQDHHLMVEKGFIQVRKGAYENEYRPSIDVLFRSAAAAYDSCVTGIILSGLLDDGVSGMSAIRRSGGTCIVQHPEEAQYAEMSISVLNNLRPDFVASIEEMGYILTDRLSKSCTPSEVPEDVRLEAEITSRMTSEPDLLKGLGEQTGITCPDCGGVLTLISNEPVRRYRCYTGHSFSENVLLDELVRNTEESLWVAIRMMEERKNVLQSKAQNTTPGYRTRGEYSERFQQLEVHIAQLKTMLLTLGRNEESGQAPDPS